MFNQSGSSRAKRSIPHRALLVVMAGALLMGAVTIPAFAQESQQDGTLAQVMETSPAPVEKANLSFATEKATIMIDGRSYTSASGSIEMTANEGFEFSVACDKNTEISVVKLISDTQSLDLTPSHGNTYRVSSDVVQGDITLSAVCEPVTPEQAPEKPDTTSSANSSQKSVAAPQVDALDPLQNAGSAKKSPSLKGPLSVLADSHTVTFLVGDSASTCQVRENTLAKKPADPTDPEGTANFHSWFIAGTDKPFSFSTPITEDITLRAVFDNDRHLVSFKDYKGYDLALWSVEEDGVPLDPATFPDPGMPLGQVLAYWSTSPQGAEFDGIVTDTISLYPVAAKSTTVMFITSGTPIPSQTALSESFVPKDPTADPDKIEVTRAGYTFKYWATEPVKYDQSDPHAKEYDFVQPLSGTSFLYAVWEPNNVGYFVNFYNEIADFPGDPGTTKDNYELVYTMSVAAADSTTKAGDNVQITDSIINDRVYYDKGNGPWGILDYSYFGWTDARDEGKALSGNGSTAINVYCKRISYEFEFDLTTTTDNKPSAAAQSELTLPTGNDPIKRSSKYAFVAKFGQDVSSMWPVACDLVVSNETYKFFTNWKGYWSNGPRTIDGASIHQLVNSGTTGYTKANSATTGRIIKETRDFAAAPVTSAYPITPAYANAAYSETRYYYTEATPAEVAAAKKIIYSTDDAQKKDPIGQKAADEGVIVSHTAGGVERFYKFNQTNGIVTYQNKWGPKGWPGRPIFGYQTITNAGTQPNRLTDSYQVSLADTAAAMNAAVEPGTDGTRFGYISYYMNRMDYSLTLITDGGTIGNASEAGFGGTPGTSYTKKVSFEGDISLPASKPDKSGSVFDGWYFDDAFTKPFRSDVRYTMPANDVTLYAKYKGTDILVNYFDADGALITTSTYANNETLSVDDLKDTPFASVEPGKEVKGVGIFENWYYQVSKGIYTVAYWGMPLTGTIDNSTYDLYAHMSSLKYEVRFLNQDEHGDYRDEHGDPTKEEFSVVVPSGSHNTLAKQGIYDEEIRGYMRGGEAPHGHGYTFIDWYTGENGTGTVFSTGSPVTGDISVYGFFKENLELTGSIDNGTVSYDQQNILMGDSSKAMEFVPAVGSHIAGIEVRVNGDKSALLSAQETAKISNGTYLFDAMDSVTDNWDIVVTTKPNTYLVEFVANGGSAVDPQVVVHGSMAAKPQDPTRDEFTFDGWYADEALTKPFDFGTAVTADTSVWAKWKAVEQADDPTPAPTTDDPTPTPTTDDPTPPSVLGPTSEGTVTPIKTSTVSSVSGSVTLSSSSGSVETGDGGLGWVFALLLVSGMAVVVISRCSKKTRAV